MGQSSPQPAEQQNVDLVRAFFSLLNLILALGSLWDNVQRDSTSPSTPGEADTFYRRSEALIAGGNVDQENLISVQICILSAQYLQTTGEVNRCWLQVGAAIRTAQGIGLHIDHDIETQAQQQECRRTWWYCVQMDR